jgi:hypothetical protein
MLLHLLSPHRARAKLQQAAREQIDATLTKLVPAFDLRSSEQQPQQQDAGEESTAAAEEMDGPMQEALEQLYLPVTALCSKGRYKASQLQQEVAEAAAEAAQADAAAATGKAPVAQGTSSADDKQAGSSAAAAAVGGAETKQQAEEQAGSTGSGGGACSSQLDQLLARLLSGLRSAAVKSLAEVAAGQLMLLLSLGRSVAAVPRCGYTSLGLAAADDAALLTSLCTKSMRIAAESCNSCCLHHMCTAPHIAYAGV